MKQAKELQIGDQIIDREGIEWTVEKIETVPANRKLEISFYNPLLVVNRTVGRFRPKDWFNQPAPKGGR